MTGYSMDMVLTVEQNEKYGRGANPPIDGALLRETVEDNARLRALIKDAEWDGQRGRDGDACCPWCQAYDDEKHLDTCPAFTPEGAVR